MAKNSNIEWTHHTFNPWWGCQKVSPACKYCYAQTWAKRCGGSDLWGSRSRRRFFSDRHWGDPVRWNRAAEAIGVRQRVFCASMADVFEKRDELNQHRERLWILIENTPHLDWLLLTKRIEEVESYVPWGASWPINVWLGATVENQQYANDRIPVLLESNAHVKFLSCEPLLGNLEIEDSLTEIDWVIAGGESGGKARPTNPDWLRNLRDQCSTTNTAFHFKQWGNWFPMDSSTELNYKNKRVKTVDGSFEMVNVGKKAAGRILDGREWNEVPIPA